MCAQKLSYSPFAHMKCAQNRDSKGPLALWRGAGVEPLRIPCEPLRTPANPCASRNFPLQTLPRRAIIPPIGDEEEQRPINRSLPEKAVCALRMLKAAPEICGKFASELFLRNSSKRKRVGSVTGEKRIGKAVSPCGIWVVTRGNMPSSHTDGGFFFSRKKRCSQIQSH